MKYQNVVTGTRTIGIIPMASSPHSQRLPAALKASSSPIRLRATAGVKHIGNVASCGLPPEGRNLHLCGAYGLSVSAALLAERRER
jgi:hypothetical protein